MRTIVDLPQNQVKILKRLSRAKSLSRAEIVRRALADYLHKIYSIEDKEVFGILSDFKRDSVEYQRELREEWEDSL